MIHSTNIRQLFSNKACSTPQQEYGYKFFVLEEKAPNSKLKKFKIIGVSDDALLIKTDYSKPLNKLLGNDDIKKRCDYILFTSFNNYDYIVLVELKSERVSKSYVNNQLKGGGALTRYFEGLLSFFYNTNNCFEEYHFKRLLFYYEPIPKTSPHWVLDEDGITPLFYAYPNPQNPPLSELIQS